MGETSPRGLVEDEEAEGNLTVDFNGGRATWIGPAMGEERR
jgi:hypothetical protein